MIVFFNGKLTPEKKVHISITDHGFLYGDGVYETIRVYNGKPFLLGEHLRRLNNSLLGIRLTPPESLLHLGSAVQKTVAANKHKEAVVRLTITRGPGAYGFNPAFCKRPTVVITSMPFKPYPAESYSKGITAAVVSIRRNSPKSLPPSIKSTSCLNGILAKMESLDLSAQEGLLLTGENTLSEGTVSNIFLVKNGVLRTPVLEGDLLPGVTREWVCRLARRGNIKVEEETLDVVDLMAADEVFMTSTLMEVMPVTRVILNHQSPQKSFKVGSGRPGAITKDIEARFSESVHRFQRI